MSRFVKYMILGIFLSVTCLSSQGQETPRYRPQRPTVSPYLNLLRNDSGPLPNYYSLVRPQVNQQAFANQTTSAVRLQSLSTQRLEDIAQAQSSGSTGTGSVFGNRSHFYPAKRNSSSRGR